MPTSQDILQRAQKALKQKAFVEAQENAHTVIKTEPSNSTAWHILGLVSLEQKNYQEAIGYFQKAVAATPKAIYYFNMGIAHRRLGNIEAAIESYEKCLKLDPKMVRAWGNLGNAYRSNEQNLKALKCYTRSLNLDPENSLTHYNMGILFHLEERYDDAIKAYRRAIKYNPDNAKALCNLGTVYSKLRRYDKSITYYQQALQLDPYLFDAYNNYGGTLIELGKLDEADEKLRKALKLQPDSAPTLRNITLCKSYKDPNDNDAQYILKLLENEKLGHDDKIHLYFALGKVYHDAKQFEKAFYYYKLGNDLNYDQHPFNIFSLQDYVRQIQDTFDETFIVTHRNMTNARVQPLLIIGPPRSGKSLLEKILTDHPDINGAGEVGLAEFASKKTTDKGTELFPQWVQNIEEMDVKRIVEKYENRILRDTNQRVFLVDTMPGNAFYLGLFAMMFPQMKVIFIDRDPLDLNLFMYFKYFVNKHYYAYNLKTLGRYHRIFQSLIEHWVNVLPGQTYSVKYEDLILNTQETVEGIISYLKLDPIKTKIKPLNSYEIGQHKYYDAQLEPLRQGLLFDPKSDSVRVKQVLKVATQKHKEKKYEEAAKLYRFVLQYEPQNPVPIHLLGVIAFETGRIEKAIELIGQALDINPNYAQAHNNMGVILQQNNQAVEADIHFRKAQAIVDATQNKHLKSLTQEQRFFLSSAFNKEFKVLQEYERKILFKGDVDENLKTESFMTKSWDWYFKDLSYGSYRIGGTKENPIWRLRAWHFLFKNLSIINKLFTSDKKEIKILDVGCSSGFFRRFLEGNITPNETKKIYYWGLDIRQHMLEKGLKETTNVESGAAGNYCPTAYLVHDVENGLPFQDNFFDVVINFEMIKYLPMKIGVQLIYEMYRVLQEDGQLFLSTAFDPKRKDFMQGMTFDKQRDILVNKGFEVQGEYGGQAATENLLGALKGEDKAWAEKLLAYHSPDMVSAILTPLYPEIASQRVFHLHKGTKE